MTLKTSIALIVNLFAVNCFGILPDTLTVTTVDVTGDGVADTVNLTKHSVRAVNYVCLEYSKSNGYVIEWKAVSNRLYRVSWTNTLTNGFETLKDNIEYPINSYTDTVHHAESQVFYQMDARLP